jgi:hypothetical protein
MRAGTSNFGNKKQQALQRIHVILSSFRYFFLPVSVAGNFLYFLLFLSDFFEDSAQNKTSKEQHHSVVDSLLTLFVGPSSAGWWLLHRQSGCSGGSSTPELTTSPERWCDVR